MPAICRACFTIEAADSHVIINCAYWAAEAEEALPTMSLLASQAIARMLNSEEADHPFYCSLQALLQGIIALLDDPAHGSLCQALQPIINHELGVSLSRSLILEGCQCALSVD